MTDSMQRFSSGFDGDRSGASAGPATGAAAKQPSPMGGASSSSSSVAPTSPFMAVCKLLLRMQVTRWRLLLLGGLGVVAMLVGWAYGDATIRNHLTRVTEFVNDYGISLLVPVATLLFASSAFGDPTDDKTLVYLWLRPIKRSQLVLAAALTSFLVAWPLIVPSLAVTAALSGGGRDLVAGTVLASTVGVAGYTGVFVALGVRVRWPLVWGLFYVLIWEGVVARNTDLAAYVALRGYASSILSRFTGASLDLSGVPVIAAVALPLAFGALGLAYATRRLSKQDVA